MHSSFATFAPMFTSRKVDGQAISQWAPADRPASAFLPTPLVPCTELLDLQSLTIISLHLLEQNA